MENVAYFISAVTKTKLSRKTLKVHGRVQFATD